MITYSTYLTGIAIVVVLDEVFQIDDEKITKATVGGRTRVLEKKGVEQTTNDSLALRVSKEVRLLLDFGVKEVRISSLVFEAIEIIFNFLLIGL